MSEENIKHHGIDLEKSPQTLRAVLDLFKEKRVPIYPQQVNKMRQGIRSGTEIHRRLDAAEALKKSVAKKDHYYLMLAVEGLALRNIGRGHRSKSTPRYSSRGFITNLAAQLTVDGSTVNRCFRAIRTDIVEAELNSDEGFKTEEFLPYVEHYINSYTTGGRASKRIERLDVAWDRKTLSDFYRLYYEVANQIVTAGTLPPYEVEMFEIFYARRLALGSKPSPLDQATLVRRKCCIWWKR